MVIVMAVILMMGGVVGVSKKQGVFHHDTTVQDTIAFEQQAAQTAVDFVNGVAARHPGQAQ